jgi:hypothetical protein
MPRKHNRKELLLYALQTHDYLKIRTPEFIQAAEDEGICVTCLDEGTIETLDCTKPASICCGGCYKTIPCPDCK